MVFLNIRNFFVIGSAILSMVSSNLSIFLCGVTVFGILLAALQSGFFCACVYFCYKTGFDTVISCPVAVLQRFTETISKAFIMTDAEILWYNHSTFTLYHYFIIVIIIIIIILLLLLIEKVISMLVQS